MNGAHLSFKQQLVPLKQIGALLSYMWDLPWCSERHQLLANVNQPLDPFGDPVLAFH